MKKFVSIALALVMILALGTVAMAEDKTTQVDLDLGDEAFEWSVPDKIELTSESTTGNGKVSFVTWKVLAGASYSIVCNVENNGTLTLSDGNSNTVDCTVLFNELIVESTTSDEAASADVSVSLGAVSQHLAGEYSGSLIFTCSHS